MERHISESGRRRHSVYEVANVFDLSFTTNHPDVVIRKNVRVRVCVCVCICARACVCETDFDPERHFSRSRIPIFVTEPTKMSSHKKDPMVFTK